MIRLLLVSTLLTSCQLIINHNEFIAGDASFPDVTMDTPTIDDQVTSPAANRVRFASAVILANQGADPSFEQDGTWILDVTRSVPVPDHYLIALEAGFAAAPRCVCTTIGANNHGCTLSEIPESREIRVTVWPDPESNAGQNQISFYLMCVGASETTAPPHGVESPTTGNTMLATAHITTNGIVDIEDGNWIQVTPRINEKFSADFVATPFLGAPNCDCRGVGEGTQGCKVDSSATTQSVDIVTWHDNEITTTKNELGPYLLCAGPTVADRPAGSMRSPSATPMLLASAHVGVTGTVTTQDGSWATASRSNTGHYSISMSGFSAAPTCTCTAVSSQQVQCSPRAIIQPDMLEVEIWAEPSTPLLDAAFDVICVGPTL